MTSQQHDTVADTAQAIVEELAQQSRTAFLQISSSAHEQRNQALYHAAHAIRAATDEIIAANAQDITAGRSAGLTDAFIDRLSLDADRIAAMAAGLENIAGLEDPIGRELSRWTVPSGLDITRISTALGVIGVIYESRPNVTVDAGGLAIKSGNSALLRGGSDSYHTSRLLAQLMQQGLVEAGLDAHAIQMIPTTDRNAVGAMLSASGLIDVIIPRGGKSLVSRVQNEARVPVFAHLEGICHLYISAHADPEKAINVAVNAKMRRVGICGAAETVLIDRGVTDELRTALCNALLSAGCEIRAGKDITPLHPDIIAAGEDDFGTEFLAPVLAMKTVEGIEEAIAHIAEHGSGHTESIITENQAEADQFLSCVDSAIVMHNASTQFADGGEFGMGAEIGIATGRLHARGPVGAAQLTSFKYIVRGNGNIRT